jgi:hypothetical protein
VPVNTFVLLNRLLGQINRNEMETSIFLAKVLGLFGAISTLAIISRYKMHLKMEEDAAKSPSMIYLSGYLFLGLGILITVSHQVWTADWRTNITILGWLILLKGLMRILFPDTIKKLIEKKKSDQRFILAEIIAFLISIYLIYQGFIVN